jgi:hypothetical protein
MASPDAGARQGVAGLTLYRRDQDYILSTSQPMQNYSFNMVRNGCVPCAALVASSCCAK